MSDADRGNNFTEENKKEEEEQLAILNLEIEKGVIKQIKLYKNANSEEVAYNFCKENNIDFSFLNQIKNEIDSLMQKYFKLPSEEKNLLENASPKNDFIDTQNNYINNNNTLNDGNSNYRYYTSNTKSNLSNNVYNSNDRKLFFYQFLEKDKFQKSRKSGKNNSNGYHKFKPTMFNTITSTKSNKYNKIPRIKSGKSYKYNNNHSFLTQDLMTNNNNSNIFERLYRDAKIKRVVYKRPCHYSNSSKENKIYQDYNNNVYETINGKTFNKMTIDMKPSYLRSYQIKPYQMLNKECSFQPNIYRYNFNNNLSSTYYSNNLYESSEIYNATNKTKSNTYASYNMSSNHKNYLNNNLNFTSDRKTVPYEESYIPLKDKIKILPNYIGVNNLNTTNNMEAVSVEAFSNLFNILTDYDQSHILNKNNINLNNIDNNSIVILSPIIKDINNNEIELDLDSFMNRIFKDISNEDKKVLIVNYSTVSTDNKNNYIDTNQNISYKKLRGGFDDNKTNSKNRNSGKKSKISKFNKNEYKISNYYNFRKNNKISTGTEKKRNFYYL